MPGQRPPDCHRQAPQADTPGKSDHAAGLRASLTRRTDSLIKALPTQKPFLFSRVLDATAIAQLHAHIHSRVAASCRDHGLRPPDQMHAVRIDPNVSATAAGAYIAKGGEWTPAEEMTRGDLKTGRAGSRTPFQILADYYQAGDTLDRDLWREYCRVTRNLAAVRWSRGLREVMLGGDAGPELKDVDLAAEDVHGSTVAAIQHQVWSHIRNARIELALLVAAEVGGRVAVATLLREASSLRARPMRDAKLGFAG